MKPAINADAQAFAQNYLRAVTAALSELDRAKISRVIEILWEAYLHDQQIFFLGNGGSATAASHLVTDLAKGVLGHRGDTPVPPVRAISLTANQALLTAWANDVGYESIFVGQLRAYLLPHDVVVAISASGNSENVLRAVRFAREQDATIIGLAGLGGGALAPLADTCITIASNHYGVIEDIHLQIGHIISSYFRQRITEVSG